MTTPDTPAAPRATEAMRDAARWNEQVAVGARVTYRDDNGTIFHTTTLSKASVLGGHTAVVWLYGKSGCVALDRVGHTLAAAEGRG